MTGLLLGIGILAILGIFVLPILASQVASAYPELIDMQKPMLILGELVITTIALALVLALNLLRLAYSGKGFSVATVKTLRLIGWVFLFALLPLIAIIVYTESRVKSSISNIYMAIGCGIFFIAGNLFHLLAELFAHGEMYKSELDLTV